MTILSLIITIFPIYQHKFFTINVIPQYQNDILIEYIQLIELNTKRTFVQILFNRCSLLFVGYCLGLLCAIALKRQSYSDSLISTEWVDPRENMKEGSNRPKRSTRRAHASNYYVNFSLCGEDP